MAAGEAKRTAKRRRKPTVVAEMRTGASAAAEGLAGALDEVRATVLALLASLGEKEQTLRERARVAPSTGVTTGLADIYALRGWAHRTLRTIEVLDAGQSGELPKLLEELGEFDRILSDGK